MNDSSAALQDAMILDEPYYLPVGHEIEVFESAWRNGLPVLLIGMDAPPNYGPEYEAAFDAMYPELAAQHGAYARQQFARVEGVGQVVVCTDLQSDDAVDVVTPRQRGGDFATSGVVAKSVDHDLACHRAVAVTAHAIRDQQHLPMNPAK